MFTPGANPQGFATMPALPSTVALYLTALAISDRKVATIERALVAICQAHELHGFPSPRSARSDRVLQGIRRTIGVAPSRKDPVLVDTLRALVEPMRRDDAGDVRDRALLCLGFASGCGRSELVALDRGRPRSGALRGALPPFRARQRSRSRRSEIWCSRT